jgi:hypothetical protein
MKSQASIAIALVALLAMAPRSQSNSPGTPQNTPSAASNTMPDANTAQDKGAIPLPLPRGKKLVLADGTFQIVREYSVQGDRVRFWSVERSAWEEIPTALVDWDATRKAEAEQAAQDAELRAKIHASDMAERTKDIDVDRSFEVQPGLFLPDGAGLYSLENKSIRELKQTLAVSKKSTGREIGKILTGIPVIPSKQTLEIPGARAAVRFSTADPEFFMRPADQREPRFRLLRAQVRSGNRLLDSANVYRSGQQTHQATDIEFQTWTPARGLFRYTLGQRLEPGEYAFVEMTKDGINSYVWDFGIDAPRTNTRK